jgi:hypothetical protein
MAACADQDDDHLPQGAYEVDPILEKYYEQLGGMDVLGPAISPIFERDGTIYQYTHGGLLVYDRNLPAGNNHYLAPLGRDMNLYEMPISEPEEMNGRYVDGHVIDEQFLPLYDRLGGKEVVGKPLTDAHLNTEKKRYEQYFENLGFYWIDGDSPENVQLLSYGAWKCDRHCRHTPPLNSIINLPSQSAEPFVKAVGTLGLDFTGFALTGPYIAPNGSLEQVYENVVLVANLDHPENVSLLPLPGRVGVIGDALMPPSDADDVVFYAEQGEMGYNVPKEFLDYIEAHRGLEFSGRPITQVHHLDQQTFRQCFENICLRGSIDNQGETQIAPESLGLRYRDLFYRPQVRAGTPEGGFETDITVQIWEAYPMVSSDMEQEIGVIVYSGDAPLSNVSPTLELTVPGGDRYSYPMPATDYKGESKLSLEPLEAGNGTLIPYKVCVTTGLGQAFCIMDSFLIWNADYITIAPEIPPEGFTAYLPFVLRNIDVYIPVVLESFKTYLPVVANTE